MEQNGQSITLDKVDSVFSKIQNLQIAPTEHNVMLIAGALLTLKDIYRGITEMQAELDAAIAHIRELEDRNAEMAEQLMPAPDDSICDEAPENVMPMPEREE